MTGTRSNGGAEGSGGEAGRALARWIGEDLARQHGAALKAELPQAWLAMIAAAERLADKPQAGA